MPVEDAQGQLSGLVTSDSLIQYFVNKSRLNKQGTETVQDIMIEAPIVIDPNATIIEAIQLMRKNEIGCLPVVKEGELIGMITENEFLKVSNRLIERLGK